MRLTDHTDYSLRTLMYLNQHKKLITLNELSDVLGVSKNNLIKVSNQLAKLDLIETIKGRKGGILVGKDTGQKTLKEIILLTEETFHMAECFSANRSDCPFLPKCALQKAINSALQAFLTSLGNTTLNEVTPKQL